MISKWFKVILLLALYPYVVKAELAIITHPSLPITSLSKEEIYKIYLGKTKFLLNGAKVIPVDQRPGSLSREKFYKEIIQKTESEMNSYWSRTMSTGQGYPPIQELDDKAVKELVSKNHNCLGYIDKSLADDSVKIVFSLP